MTKESKKKKKYLNKGRYANAGPRNTKLKKGEQTAWIAPALIGAGALATYIGAAAIAVNKALKTKRKPPQLRRPQTKKEKERIWDKMN